MATYVMIHGGWHGGWAWRPVSARLQALGHRVFSPTLPGIGDGDDPTQYTMDDCFKSIADLITSHDLRDVILVAHSWGACVGLGAVQLVPDRLKMFVPFSSGIPLGESLLAATTQEHRDLFKTEAALSGNNTVGLTYEAWVADFIPDGTPEVQRLTHSLLNRHPMQYFEHTIPTIDPSAVPFDIRYILADDDRTAPREQYLAWCASLGCEPIATPGGHEALLTRPAELTDVLLSL